MHDASAREGRRGGLRSEFDIANQCDHSNHFLITAGAFHESVEQLEIVQPMSCFQQKMEAIASLRCSYTRAEFSAPPLTRKTHSLPRRSAISA